MIISPLSRRAADEFARAVEDRAPAGPQLGRYVDLVDEIVEVGRSLPGPSPEFRDALWRRLSVLDVQDNGTTTSVPESTATAVDGSALGSPGVRTWRRRLALSGVAAGVIAGILTGTAVASTNALPGDALYGIKRTMEEVRLALTESDVGKGRRYLDIAETRLSEIQRLMQQDEIDTSEVERIAATFADMWQATQQGSELLLTSYERTQDRSTLVTLLVAVDRQRLQLGEIRLIAPADLRDETDAARSLLEVVTTDVLNREPLAEELVDGDLADGEAGEGGDAEIIGCPQEKSAAAEVSTRCTHLAAGEVTKRPDPDADASAPIPQPTSPPGEVGSSAASADAPTDAPSYESSSPTATAGTTAPTSDGTNEDTTPGAVENSTDDNPKDPGEAKPAKFDGRTPAGTDGERELNAAKPTNPPGHDNRSAEKADHAPNDRHRGRPQPPHTIAPHTVQISVPGTGPLSFPLDLIRPTPDATVEKDDTA